MEPIIEYATRPSDDWPLQLRTLQTTLQTELEHRPADLVVLRAMDFFGSRGLSDGVVRRLQSEGVVLAALRARYESVAVLNGREIASTCGTSKDALWQRAGELVDSPYVDAAAAALAAGHLAGGDD